VSEPVTESDLQAYADGELPESRRADVAAWLASHPDDAERIESYRRIAEELRSTYKGVLDEPVPERLKQALPVGRARRVAMIALWAVVGVAVGGIAGWELRSSQAPTLVPVDAAAALARRAAVAQRTRKRISSRGSPSAWARRCARRSSRRLATAWSVAGSCPEITARSRT
jgi:anti-sigma factor RsiW